MEMLPAEQRQVIELAYFQGWTHAEIAAGCQLPLGTVKGRLRLGLIRMKHILAQIGV
jgi:RNA polymerase sigma-70 factor (ECF subfamily)